LCEADHHHNDDVQDEQHAIFHCTHPHTMSLRRRYESLFSEARAQDVFTFCTRPTTDSNFSTWTVFFMSRPAFARFDWRPFLVDLVFLLGVNDTPAASLLAVATKHLPALSCWINTSNTC
jgi:hypothetical protein